MGSGELGLPPALSLYLVEPVARLSILLRVFPSLNLNIPPARIRTAVLLNFRTCPPNSSWSLTGVAGGVLCHVAWEGKAERAVVRGHGKKEAVVRAAELEMEAPEGVWSPGSILYLGLGA